jgi:hypothetical protein
MTDVEQLELLINVVESCSNILAGIVILFCTFIAAKAVRESNKL